MNPYIYNPPPPPPSAVQKKLSTAKNSNNNKIINNGKPLTSHLKANPPQLRKRPEPYTIKPPPPPQKPKQPQHDVTVVEPKSNAKISLNTEQEIQAWIAERKRRWPTEARVQAKKELEEKQKKEKQSKVFSNSSETNDNANNNRQRTPGTCKYFLAGRCHNTNCRFLHSTSNQGQQQQMQKVAGKIYKLYEAPKKAPLFKMLVQNDLDEENKKVIDFIDYICNNNVI